MKAKAVLSAAMIGAVFSLAGTAVGQEPDKELKRGEVPQAVLQAFERDHPQVKAVEYEQETREGVPYYEIEYKMQGKEEESIYSADGTFIEQHEEISTKEVPAAVLQAVKREQPKAAIKEAEKVMKPDKTLIAYEIEIAGPKMKERELTFDPTGKLLRQEQE